MEVGEIRGHIVDGAIDHWQVGVKIGFTLEAEDAPETLEEKKS
jgi:flavin-binding protein dodecin